MTEGEEQPRNFPVRFQRYTENFSPRVEGVEHIVFDVNMHRPPINEHSNRHTEYPLDRLSSYEMLTPELNVRHRNSHEDLYQETIRRINESVLSREPELHRIREGILLQSDTTQALEPLLSEDTDSFKSRHGLFIRITNHSSFYDGTVGKMDFSPDGAFSFDAGHQTERLLWGIEGLQEFFAQVDKGSIHKPKYLEGYTNERMARATKRLGFSYEIFSGKYIRVHGKTDDIRKKLQELSEKRDTQGQTVVDKLRKRLAPAAGRKTHK